jgi:hypothetical protein
LRQKLFKPMSNRNTAPDRSPTELANPMKCSPNPYSLQAPYPKFAAALEVLGFLLVAAVATVCFLTRHLTTEQGAVLTLLILLSLIVLAWTRFDGGRHPCFLFLCMLTLFQAGRLMASWTGGGDRHISSRLNDAGAI